MRKSILLLWPSFLIALLASVAFFSVFDPHELSRHGVVLFNDAVTAYSCFMLIAWGFGALNSAIVLFLIKSRQDINGFPPLDPPQIADDDAGP
ncbi:hypothetical protein [Paludibacterium yongneupense]|uniref:hypothetical protein n=1 Tax=Paludibacterium yongneupense TaxID=400061 RepID=UPI0003F8F8AA|nr:hypothetical protein [Paludibacterium yongneupense]